MKPIPFKDVPIGAKFRCDKGAEYLKWSDIFGENDKGVWDFSPNEIVYIF